MADDITAKEAAKYATIWGHASYRERSPGMRFLDDAMERMKPRPGATILDIGCGTGRVARELESRGFVVTGLDIAPNACDEFEGRLVVAPVWDLPSDIGRYDYGFCADVMEHLPTDKVRDSLSSIASCVDVCYFQIANFVCHEGDSIGESLHLTVKPYEWWAAILREFFAIESSSAETKHHLFLCKPRSF